LIVDDDAGVRDVCTSLLHALGYHAAAASSGFNAMERLASNDCGVSLVLVDLEMPGMRGDEVLRAVKASRPHVRVLMMSGRPRAELSGYLRDGADGVLRKPFGLSELGSCVGAALDS
jgi:CheY-like chemotaxis protein